MNIPTLANERWRQVPNSHYWVSNFGRVYSAYSRRLLKTLDINGSRYTAAKLFKNQHYVSVARLVLWAFKGQEIDSKRERIAHKDGNKKNFSPSNLVIAPRYNRRLNDKAIKEIRSNDYWGHGSEMARKYGVSRQLVSLIKQGKIW